MHLFKQSNCQNNMEHLDRVAYSAARFYIKDGDFIAMRRTGRSSLWHKFTTWVTGAPHYHCGIALWMATRSGFPRLFICEAGTKRRVVLLSSYLGTEIDVLVCPVGMSRLEEPLLSKVGTSPYSLVDYISIGFRLWFGLVTRVSPPGEVCSEMVQSEYANAGFQTSDTVLSPGELYKLLLEKGCAVRVKISA